MPDTHITEAVARFIAQLAVILFAAKLSGEVTERWLRQPAVLGELVAGIIIGPYALGGLPLPGLGEALFSHVGPESGLPVPTELFALAQVASVVLLFLVGLETDLHQFLRFGAAATAVAVGGVVLPFALGAGATVLAGIAPAWTHPTALFMGAIMTATSVGITARVLSDIGQLDTPEGVTILGAAVVDDVLGILALAITVGIAATGSISLGDIAVVGTRAIGFWLLLTALSVFLASRLSAALLGFKTDGAALALALALALLAAFLAESFGLALIIGAYSVGLGLSQTPLARAIEPSLRAVYHALVPIFFVVMGMLVDLSALGGALEFGLVISALAIVSKLVGTGLPALGVGFNLVGAARVGLGMLPRGEVALIVAGVGLTSGIINPQLFGVAILMTVVTTLFAPIALVPVFQRGGPGRRQAPAAEQAPEPRTGVHAVTLDTAIASLFMDNLERALEQRDFERAVEVRDPEGPIVGQYRHERELLSVSLSPAGEGRQDLVIEYESDRWPELLAAAVKEAAQGMASEVFGPLLAATSPDEQRERIRAALGELLAEATKRG